MSNFITRKIRTIWDNFKCSKGRHDFYIKESHTKNIHNLSMKMNLYQCSNCPEKKMFVHVNRKYKFNDE